MPESKNKYSIIIPSFNEELFIGKNIKEIRKIMPGAEIIVVDCGSNDQTINICKREEVRVIKSKRGRGTQLNEGAKNADGNILVFLHADTYLPKNASELYEQFFNKEKNKICRFKLSFDIEHRLLNRYGKLSKLDLIFTRFGDMCIAVRRDFYFEAGGFPEWNFMEDVEFLRNASSKSRIVVLPASVISSARAYLKHGFVNKQLINGLMLSKYTFGFRKFIERNEYYNKKVKFSRASIIIFTKYPEEGKVKTRLASTIGYHYAMVFYKMIAEKIIFEVKRIRTIYTYIFFSEEKEKINVKKWLGQKYFYSHQEGEGLGERMYEAFRKVFGHGANKVILTGTDIPDLSKVIIEEAIINLDNYDIVIGPAKDGGYYLLGMNKLHSSLFEDIEFSTPSVLSQTINTIEKLKLRYFLLPELQDIDTNEELVDWLNNSQSSVLKKEIRLIYNLINRRIEKKCIHCGQ